MERKSHALVLGFNFNHTMQHLLEDVEGRRAPIEALCESKTVLGVLEKDGKTSERRLQIDISEIRESYENAQLVELFSVHGNISPTDALKKCILVRLTQMG